MADESRSEKILRLTEGYGRDLNEKMVVYTEDSDGEEYLLVVDVLSMQNITGKSYDEIEQNVSEIAELFGLMKGKS